MRCGLGRCVSRWRACESRSAVSQQQQQRPTQRRNGSNKSPKQKPGPQARARTPVIYCEIRDIARRQPAASQRTYIHKRTSQHHGGGAPPPRAFNPDSCPRALPCIRYCAPVHLPSRLLLSPALAKRGSAVPRLARIRPSTAPCDAHLFR